MEKKKTEKSIEVLDDNAILDKMRYHREYLALKRDILSLELELKHLEGIIDGTISTEEPDGE